MLKREALAAAHVDPRVKRTRQLITEAFQNLLGEKSFEAITVQDIADHATVNRATFYAHFEDKYDLLDHAFAEGFRQLLHKNLPPGSEFSPLNLQLLIQTICEFLGQLYSHCKPSGRTQFDSLLEQQLKTQIYEVLVPWFQSRAEQPLSGDAELRASVTSWAIYGAALWWNQDGGKKSAAEFARHVLPLIRAGLEKPF